MESDHSSLLPPLLQPSTEIQVSISLTFIWFQNLWKVKYQFIPVPPSYDIDLWFFIRVVVDHNHTKLCEATLSYQSLLGGIWLRDHVSCTDLQACCRPFRHMPSHRERTGKVFWEFYSVVKLCVYVNVCKVDDLSNRGSQVCLKHTSGSPFPSQLVPHASWSI